MNSPLEQLNMSFRKHTGKETEVRIISEVLINSGDFGNIFDSIIEIGGHKKRFIIKKYVDKPLLTEEATINAQSAFRNYSLAKEAGLKVFPTFRMGEDEKSILMTTGFLDKQVCVGSNNAISVVESGQPLIKKIEDESLDEFLSSFFTEGLKAIKKGISFYSDIPFFLVSKEGPTKIDFILGDFDNLTKAELTKHNGIMNMIEIDIALGRFCGKNIDPSFQESFLKKVKYYYGQAIQNIENDNTLLD